MKAGVALLVAFASALGGGPVAAQGCGPERDRAALIVTLAPGHVVERIGPERCLLRGRIGRVWAGDARRGAALRAEFPCATDRPAAPGGPVFHAPDGVEAAERIELHVTADGRIAYGGRGLIARVGPDADGAAPWERPACD